MIGLRGGKQKPSIRRANVSVIFTVIVVLGLLGAVTFLTGFVKGVREAVRDYRHPEPEAAWTDEGHYGLSAFFAVLASAIVIGLVGVAPAWIYAGPLLAIVTATGVGLAFLLGNRRQAGAVRGQG
jgi:hypothetical protein